MTDKENMDNFRTLGKKRGLKQLNANSVTLETNEKKIKRKNNGNSLTLNLPKSFKRPRLTEAVFLPKTTPRKLTIEEIVKEYAPLTGEEYLTMGDSVTLEELKQMEEEERERIADLNSTSSSTSLSSVNSNFLNGNTRQTSVQLKLGINVECVLKELEKIQKRVLDDSCTLAALLEMKEVAQLGMVSEMLGGVLVGEHIARPSLSRKEAFALTIKQIANKLLQIKSQVLSGNVPSSRYVVINQIISAIKLYLESGNEPDNEIVKIAVNLWSVAPCPDESSTLANALGYDKDQPIQSAYIKVSKYKKGFFGKAKQRYVMLTPQCLKVYKDKTFQVYKFSILIPSIDRIFSLRLKHEGEFQFCIQTKSKKYAFAFNNVAMMAKWMVKIDDSIIYEGLNSKISSREKKSALKFFYSITSDT